jgi:hypothetical protein
MKWRRNEEKEKKIKKGEKCWRGQTASCGAFMRPGNGPINP